MTCDDRPRVLHLITNPGIGGVENHLVSVLEGLTERGFETDVVYLKGDDPFADADLVDTYRRLGSEVTHIPLRWVVDPVCLVRLYRYMVAREYDIVHTHLFYADLYGMTTGRLASVPVMLSSKHNDPPFQTRQPYRTVHSLVIRGFDLVFAISDHVRSFVIDHTAIDPERVQTVHYGLDPGPFDETPDDDIESARAEFASEDQPLIGTVARLTEQKDIATLLTAFARVSEEVGSARLAVVGKGPELPALRDLSRELGIADEVSFAGFREDIHALMRAFDVFVLPSRWEGFGLVFLEAMAARTPIVASDVSAIPEIIVDGQTGYLVRPGDIEGFADRIVSLINDPEKAREMGEAGRERLDERFTEERMVRAIVDSYDDLLSPRREAD